MRDHVVIASNTCWYVHNFRLSLIRALTVNGWKVTVLAPRDRHVSSILEAGAAFHHIAMEPKGTNPLRELAAIRQFRSAYRELSPAVALHHTIKPDIYGSIAGRLAGVPVVNTITGLGTMFSGGPREAMIRTLYKFAFAHAELTLFQNPDDRALFITHRIVREAKTGLLPGSGVDLQRFSPRPREPGPFTFLLVGRLLRAKGVEDFIEAARKVKGRNIDSRFILVGSHDAEDPDYANPAGLQEAVQERIVERHDHVDDIRPFLAAADCVVLPSYYREGIPRSLLEAASMGKPLIAANSVGTREPVQDGVNGFLCRPRDPADLASKMEIVLGMSPEKRAAMGSASRSFMCERFDERFVVTAYLQAVERIVASPPGGHS